MSRIWKIIEIHSRVTCTMTAQSSQIFCTLILGHVDKKKYCQKRNYYYIYCVYEQTNGKKIYDPAPETLTIRFYTYDVLNWFFSYYTDRVPDYTQDTNGPPITNTMNCNNYDNYYHMRSSRLHVIIGIGCIFELPIAAERIRPQNVYVVYARYTLLFLLRFMRA